MNETQLSRRRGRSIAALLTGFLAVVVLSLATDVALHATGVFPEWGRPMGERLLLLALTYRALYGIAGSYIVARMAPDRPMQHALLSGAVGLIVSTAGAVATWNAGQAYGPHWYPLAIIATAMPCAWAGGRLEAARSGARRTQ